MIFAEKVLTRSWDPDAGRFIETTRGYFYERRADYGDNVAHYDFLGFAEEIFVDSKDADRAPGGSGEFPEVTEPRLWLARSV